MTYLLLAELMSPLFHLQCLWLFSKPVSLSIKEAFRQSGVISGQSFFERIMYMFSWVCIARNRNKYNGGAYDKNWIENGRG